ncbi:diguanylate cyclase (GGDEF)-like protein [Hamadaea flava]|uniref:GGDEF domain-containing protein n=1 Tax=Hamadaea flava TaxID=1742688 RepID=A0ABV8LDS3_9ACTN|nr:GGDEF domain-containing protein [Hamadaea flava]MCP2323416.1 diguanylate cyclase (GGDEF)-like protein [Hamadaea flava]
MNPFLAISASGTIAGLIAALAVALHNLRRLRGALVELTWRADHDQLTRLPNRHVLHATLGLWLQRRRPVAVAMLDLDDFKQINDDYGYAAGDTVLVFAADRVARAASYTGGVAARLGGDEFVITWSDVDHDTAARHAAAVLETVTRDPVLVRHRELPLPASVGLVVSNGLDDYSVSRLLAQADEARSHAKATGKNRLVVWHGQLPAAEGRIRGGRPNIRLRDTN